MASSGQITACTKIVGLIGWPVSHSISPRMHNAAFAATGLDWRYVPFPVSPYPEARIGEAVRGLRGLGLRGANVTVPHKQAVISWLNRLSPAAQAIGAVNTIRVEDDDTLYGDNTDARGFVADLSDHGVDPTGVHALVLGAGGSARAVAFGLAEAGAASVTVLNRTLSRAEGIAQAMSRRFPTCRWEAGPWPQGLSVAAPKVDLVVNCTSLGMEPDSNATPWCDEVPLVSRQIVYDLVYNPERTKLIEHAVASGARAISGKGMLVWQGAMAFELWTGAEAPIDIMKEAIGIRTGH